MSNLFNMITKFKEKVKYFSLGLIEFRNSFTTSPPLDCSEAYDKGREFAHKITLRFYDDI